VHEVIGVLQQNGVVGVEQAWQHFGSRVELVNVTVTEQPQHVPSDSGIEVATLPAAQPLVCRKNSVNVESLCACCGDESGAAADLNPRRIAKKIQMNGVSASLLLDKMSL
jgi:hypothetical protein